MWPFTKTSARGKEIRRSKAERGLVWYSRLLVRLPLWPSLVTIVAGALAAAAVNLGGEVLPYRVGQTVPRAMTSRVEFSVANAQRTTEMRVRARDQAPLFYELDVSLLDDIRGRLTNALQIAREHRGDPTGLQEEARKSRILLDEDGRAELLRIAGLSDADELQRALDRYQKAVDSVITKLAEQAPPLVEPIDAAQRRNAVEAKLLDPRRTTDAGPLERPWAVARLVPANGPAAAEAVAEAAVQVFVSPLRASMKASLLEMLRSETEGAIRPIYRFAAEASDRAAQAAYDAVPVQYDTFGRGRQLTDAGVIAENELHLLGSEHEAYRRWVSGGVRWLPAEEAARLRLERPADAERYEADLAAARAAYRAEQRAVLARGFVALLVTFGLSYHVTRRRPALRFDPRRRVLRALVLVVILLAAREIYLATAVADYAVGAQALAAALLAIIFPQGPVLAICGALAVLITLATREGPGLLITLLAVTLTLQVGLRDIRNRGKIVAVGSAAALVALLSTLAAGLIDGQQVAFVFWQQAVVAAGMTLAAAFLVEGLLPTIERLFRVSTSMTLLEWCDANKPLLRLLAAEAPGTYNHSLLVGALAETAAAAIGANGLLARTGAYYHDIGKVSKPEYFTENQGFGTSRHERLSPAMSHLIIIGHVKDGLEMARAYGLPEVLIPFIAEHQGTTLVQYFYHAASQQRRPGDREVSDVQFRYPGPKPQSRETAIVMLCDGVEGAVRALSEPTPGRIEDVVSKITQQRLMDGQFDECDLTFRELSLIERSLVKSLCAIYHSRITYPEREEKRAESHAS